MKPSSKEFDAYYHYYVNLVDDLNLIHALESTHVRTQQLISSISEIQANYKYANDKWSIKEVFAHLIDTELIFIYRALRFARSDRTELAGYDHNEYAHNSAADLKTILELGEEFQSLRNYTIRFFSGLDANTLKRSGVANNKILTVNSIGFLTVGHEIHHTNIIKEKYLGQ